jgi:hypothetical protein
MDNTEVSIVERVFHQSQTADSPGFVKLGNEAIPLASAASGIAGMAVGVQVEANPDIAVAFLAMVRLHPIGFRNGGIGV